MAVHFSKLCTLILVGTVTYNEFLCYWFHYHSWPKVTPVSEDSTILLLVADPQILGVEHEPSGVYGSIRRWDGDRYLSKAYRWALSAYSPPTVVFLGDLMDEASESDSDQITEYAERFHSIYPKESARLIYIPGDNDIGGEGVDRVTQTKIDQFEAHFGPSSPVYHARDWLDIVPVSRLTEQGVYNLSGKSEHLSPSKISIAVSHLPVLPLNGRFSEQVMNLVNPDAIFSAHDHHGYLFTGDRQTGKMAREIEKFTKRGKNVPFTLQCRTKDGSAKLSQMVWEVVVPTCSYRMGVKEMGLGLAVINKEGEIFYANLWLPGRFSGLYTYAASLVVVLTILVVRKLLVLRKYWRYKDHGRWS